MRRRRERKRREEKSRARAGPVDLDLENLEKIYLCIRYYNIKIYRDHDVVRTVDEKSGVKRGAEEKGGQ